MYDLRGEEPGAPYWPEGDYVVVFSMRQGDERWGTTVWIGDRGVVRIDFGCGRTLPDEMGPPGATDISLAASSDSPRSVGPGLTVSEALTNDADEILLVAGYIVVADGETHLCESLYPH